MITILFLIGFIALAMAIALVCAEKAPVGYEDETGFHFGSHEVRVFSALVIPAAKKSSDQPEDKKLIPLFPSRVPWMHKGIGIAALFISLLVLLPEKFQNSEKPSGSIQNVIVQEELVFERTTATLVAAPIRNEPSRFIQNLCVRFSQAD